MLDQTEFTVSEPITVANDINLLFSADAGEGIEQNSISMSLEGADGATSVVGTQAMRTGFGVDTVDGRIGWLEDGSGKIETNQVLMDLLQKVSQLMLLV